MHRLVAIFSTSLLSAVAVLAQGTSQTVQVGYAVVTPSSPITSGMTVFETITQTRTQDTLLVSVFPPNLTTNALLPVEVSSSLSKNLGVAIANPNSATANLNMTLRRADGTQLTTTTVTIVGRRQISKLVTELFPPPVSGGFSTQVAIPSEFTGTLVISSPSPVSIVGLKFLGPNYTTVPVTDLSPGNNPIPTISSGVGGLRAVLFPQFVAGAGWATEIAVANTTASSLTIRLDVFTQDGAPFTVTLNGQTFSSFTNLVIPSNGLLIMAP